MQLPKELNWEFKQQVMQSEEAKRIRYVSSIELLAGEEGEEKGRKEALQAAQRLLVKLLQYRFGEVEPQLVARLQYFLPEQLEFLTDIALTIPSLEAFKDQVAQMPDEQSAAQDSKTLS